MKFMLFALPTIPAETFAEREQLRPIGRNHDKYQQMIDELRKLAVFADQTGFDVMGTTEHHMHSEGMEASVAPMLLYTDLAGPYRTAQVRPPRPRPGCLGPNPGGGRSGGVRPPQQGPPVRRLRPRLPGPLGHIMGQQYHSTGATMDGSAVDNHNRAVFEEAVKVIKKAWTQETINHDGEYYKVPYPYDTGITR